MTTTATASSAARTIDGLPAGYAAQRPEEVADFLASYPFLVPLLREARPVIARHFGVETPVGLRVLHDRETGDDEDTQLVVSIATNLPPEEVDALEDAFWRDWWLPNLRGAQGRLVIGPTYRKRTIA
jgi:hypothetical protein